MPAQLSAIRGSNHWRGFVVPAGLLAAWIIAGAAGVGDPALLVPVTTLWHTAETLLSHGELPSAILATVARTMTGWCIGVVAGFSLGLLVGLTDWAQRAISPTVHGARQVALFAWIPLLSAWCGNGEAMKIALISLSAFFPVLLHVEAGCRNAPKPYREIGRLFRYRRRDEIALIILPSALPIIISGLELAFTTAWIGAIGAEYLIGTGYMNASADGIGAFLSGARENARMDLVIVGIVALALTGLALNRSIVFATRKVLSWHTH